MILIITKKELNNEEVVIIRAALIPVLYKLGRDIKREASFPIETECISKH